MALSLPLPNLESVRRLAGAIKIRNPFKRDYLPDHMAGERGLYKRFRNRAFFAGFIITAIITFYTPLIVSFTGFGLPRLAALTIGDKLVAYHQTLFAGEYIEILRGFVRYMGLGGAGAVLAHLAVAILGAAIAFIPALFNPYSPVLAKHGDVRWADDATIELMQARRQIGVKGAKYGILGRVMAGRYKGGMVRMIETLSTLCLAPPGTGKTAGFVYPLIVSNDESSLVIYDPKPEIFEATAGYRATVSDVFMLDWSRVDEPEKGIFYPRFNFLSPKLMPPPGPNRDTYIDTIAKILIPDEKKGGDSYFINKGRAALTGFIHYLVAKVGDARNEDEIPAKWLGKEPSIPMLIDWMAHAQFNAKNSADDGGPGTDHLSKWLSTLAESCNPKAYEAVRKAAGEGKITAFNAPRAFNEFVNLSNTADKERSGILGQMDQSLLAFKNEAVAQRTSASDFTPDDFRGRWDDKAKRWVPMTLYICVNQAEAEAFATITSLLFEVLSRSFISYGPGEFNNRTNRKMGDCPILFVLDEFAKLPMIPAVIEGPDLGRSKKVSYNLYAQAPSQIELIYGKERLQTIFTTTAVKIILPQNNYESIKLIQDMVGHTTVKTSKYSFNEGLSKASDAFGWSRSEDDAQVNFLRAEDISAIPQGQLIAIVQGFYNRPMRLRMPLYFEDPEFQPRVFARGKGPVADTVLPVHHKTIREEQHKHGLLNARREKIKDGERRRRDAMRSSASILVDP